MSRMLSKMNLISVVQQLPKEDVETIQGYVEMIEEENEKLKAELQLYQGALKREHEAIHKVNDLEEENQKYKEVIDKVSSQIKLYGKYNGEKCTRGFSVMTADFNKLLDILKEVE